MALDFSKYGTPVEEPTGAPDFSKFGTPIEEGPTEKGGFFGSFGTALKERAQTAMPALALFAGVGQKKATEDILKASKESENAYKQTEFSEIGKSFKEGNYAQALGQTIDKFKEVAGSSLGTMAPAYAAGIGAGAVLAAPLELPAAAIGTAAFGLTALGSYLADNISRQKQEQEKAGKKYEDIQRMPALAAAAGQTTLDIIGFKFFKPLGRLVGIEGKQAAEKTAMEIVQAATKPGAYRRAVARGAAEGLAFEIPQEVAQQVLERWQAGLPLDPFSDPEAAKEYMEAAGGALLLGGPLGAYSHVSNTYNARQKPGAQNILKGVSQGSVIDQMSKEEEDVRQPINPPSGTSTGLAGQPSTNVAPPPGTAGTQTAGVVSPRTDVGSPDVGEAGQPPSITTPSTDVTETTETQQTAPQGQATPAFNPKPVEEFVDSYKYLLGVLHDIDKKFEAQGELTDGQSQMMLKTLKDLRQLVDEQGLDKSTAGQLKNPSTGVAALKGLQPRAMQGELFKGKKEGNIGTEEPESLASVFGKTENERAQERARELSAEIEARNAPKKPKTVKEKFAKQFDMLDMMLTEDQRKKKAETEAQAEELKEKIKQKRQERQAKAEEFGAPVEEEETAEEAARTEMPTLEPETGEAPAVSTEHVAQTEEGQVIKNFFDDIKSGAGTEDEKQKHTNLKNVAANNALEFDIAKPGEKTSEGLKQVLNFLADRVGGMDKLKALMTRLKDSSIFQQSRLFLDNNLPDLTTRRGLTEFNNQLQLQLDNMKQGVGGIRIPRRNTPVYGTGEHRAIMPHPEEVSHVVGVSVAPGKMPDGSPRRPSIRNVEKKHLIQDPKLRAAVRDLKDFDQHTKNSSAAFTYLNNMSRKSFGDALTDLAYDIAHFEADPANHGANSTFHGEGGKYALRFKEWIEENLSKDTVEVLEKLIQEQREHIAEQQKHANAVSKYNIDIRLQKRENKIKRAEEAASAKIQRAPKREAFKDAESQEPEEIEEPKTSRRNLPRVRDISSVHPAIRRLLESGNVKQALQLVAEAEGNNYYKELANRLLDVGITATSRLINKDAVESLHSDPKIKETLNGQLKALSDGVVALLPADEHEILLSLLNSNKLSEIQAALERLKGSFRNSSAHQEILQQTSKLVQEQFAWIGKYDPSTDEIVLRGSSAGITDHLFLHEALHAATIGLIDNPDELTGARREGYDKLLELYNHAKGVLSMQGMTEDNIYGLQDLHEFVSESMTNPEFQYLLRGLRYKAAPFSLWTQFTNSISKLFGIKPGYESNVMVEAMRATDLLLSGGVTGKENISTPKAQRAIKRITTVPQGMGTQPSSFKRLLNSSNWNEVKERFPTFYNSAKASTRPGLLGMLTMRQIADLVAKRIPQVDNFIRVAENFLARKNNILRESGDISKRWERMQAAKPEVSKLLAKVMHAATIKEVDPDKPSNAERNDPLNAELLADWKELNKHPEAVQIYRDVRKFYENRFSEYRNYMNKRIIMMRKHGISEKTLLEIRNEFEKTKMKGPYFPLMRHGRFAYQIGKGATREYYMFESLGQMEAHIEDRLSKNPELETTIKPFYSYAEQLSHHAKESNFLKSVFEAVENADFSGTTTTNQKQELKDNIYQSFLSMQPERSFRNQLIHRQNIAGYSEDALRNFAASSFQMSYQLARLEHASEMFSQIEAAKAQIKNRIDVNKGLEVDVMRENNELNDYVTEMDKRLELMLNPTDIGTIPSLLSNVGFIWYLTAPASAIVNVVGGMMIGLPTLVGQYVKANPNMGYTKATIKALGEMGKVTGQILGTGFGLETGARIRDNRVLFPTLDRATGLSRLDQAAYKKFVADGLIDITATYDQSGLASAPTDKYFGASHRAMEALTSLFHNTERFNREVIAMSAFRAAMEKRKSYPDQQRAFSESIAEAKDATTRSMFDYSSPNKPRYFQHPVARVVLQFKQFPQQMTFFLAHNFVNMFKGASPEIKREARARFVGTMGMAGIFAGGTGLWGFSTVAAIVNAVVNGLGDDDEEPFDFELEFVNWAVETFGQNIGTLLTRGIGNAAGIDLANRVKLDDMWFRDNRKNQDEVQALQSMLIDALGPTVGLGINAAQAAKLLGEGHGDRALETVMPAFIKNPMVAARYASEGVNTLRGDPLMEEVSPFYLLMQSLGIRSAELSERQFYNITVKSQEQAILSKRQNLLNLYALSFLSNDSDTADTALDKIFEFNDAHPSVAIPAESINTSIKERLTKSTMTDHGLYIDKRLMGVLDRHTYMD
jgi:predicted ester cyclase